MEITKDIRYIGVDDHDIDLFEGQYDVSENGMAYNSYVILGEKIAVADSVDGGFVDEWLGNLEAVLDGRTPDYLIVHHMEPDHSAGIAAFTGDGVNPAVMEGAAQALRKSGGCGVPTIKPWNIDTIKEKMAEAKASGCFAVAMDVDAAGLPFLKNMTPPAGSKSVEELAEIEQLAERPFIVKGVMTVKGALKAKQAGAAAIVVSNHGGRVLDQCPATAEVLPEIAAALKGTGVKVLVDGGIRTGVDVFKALALGADGVLICRPFVTAVYGGGAEGVKCYIDKLAGELADTMQMCGAHTLAEITPDMVRV